MAESIWGSAVIGFTVRPIRGPWLKVLLGLWLGLLTMSRVEADPPNAAVELRNEQTKQGLSLQLEQRQLRVPEGAAEWQQADQDRRQERFQQYQLHQRQQGDSAVLRQQQRAEPAATPQADAAQRSQRQLHQQQDVGQRLQLRINRGY